MLRVGPVECVAKLAAIDLGVRADERFDFLRIIVPALQVAGAELPFFVFFVAGTLLVLADFDLD